MNSNLKWEKRILNVSFVGSILFLLAEVIMAIITDSNAVFMDCVFDIADLIMIGPFLVLIPLLYKSETEKRPYGFSQVESLFILIKSGLLIGITLFLIINSISIILNGGNEVDASTIAIFELIVSLTCVFMYFLLKKLNKKCNSPSIQAELYIWKLDSLSTLGVGLAFIVKLILDKVNISSIGPYVDPGIAIILAVILLKEPIGLFLESLKNLVLFAPDKETSNKIREICTKKMEENDCSISFLDIIKTGRKLWIEIYFVVDKDLISITKLKKITSELTKDLSASFEHISVELLPDVDEVKDVSKKIETERRPDKVKYINKVTNKKLAKKAMQNNKQRI